MKNWISRLRGGDNTAAPNPAVPEADDADEAE